MKKMYRIFGAVAIIGLFLIGSMSTGLAAQQQAVPGVQPGGQQQIEGILAYADFDDDQLPTGQVPAQPGESLDYPQTLPITHNGDLATVLAWRRPVIDLGEKMARIRVQVRNVAIDGSQSQGGTIKFHLYGTLLGLPNFFDPVYVSDTRAVSALCAWEKEVFVYPNLLNGIEMGNPLYYFKSDINPTCLYEGFGRHISDRYGFLLGVLV